MKAKAFAILRAYNEMKCRVLNVTELDFKMGLDFVRELEKDALFPFISSNLVDENGKSLFLSHVIIKENGIRFGVIGVTTDGAEFNDRIQVLDPILSAKKIAEDIQGKVDLVILLANFAYKEEKRFLNGIEKVDVIVQSGGKKMRYYPEGGKEEKPLLLQLGAQGKYAGKLRVEKKNITDNIQYVKVSQEEASSRMKNVPKKKKGKNRPLDSKKLSELITEKIASNKFGGNTMDFMTEKFGQGYKESKIVKEILEDFDKESKQIDSGKI